VAVKDSANAASNWVLAVDFGTSSTAAAIGRDGGAELVGVDGGLPRMLSNVFLDESTGALLLGELAEQSSTLAPWCFERSPKVKLGQQYMLLGDRRVSVTDAVGQVLHRVAADAIRMRGGDQPAVVRLTHPVRWGDEKRKALVQAAAAAGLGEQLELVLEPVAAATHYAHERLAPGEHVAVYDLGGGTLDTAVLKRTEDGFEVVGEPRGIDGFGGEDFDHRIYRYLGEQLAPEDWTRLRAEPEEGGDTAWPSANRQFQRNVRRAKELLTQNDSVRVEVPAPVSQALRITRDEFNGLIRTDVEESVRELATSISSAVGDPSELVAIYLAGGSSQIPLISEVIEAQLGVKPQHLNDSKAVICLGAALPPLLSEPTLSGNGNGNGNGKTTGVATAAETTNRSGLGTGTDAGTVAETAPQTTGNRTLADGTIVETDRDTTDHGTVADQTVIETDRHTTDHGTVADGTVADGTMVDGTSVETGGRAADTSVAGGTVIETGRTDPDGADTGPTRSQATSTPGRDPVTASQPPRSTPPGSKPSAGDVRRRRWVAAGVTALIVAIIAVVVVVVAGGGSSKHHNKPSPPKPKPTPVATSQTASSGPITISYKTPWKAGGSHVQGASLISGHPITLSNAAASLTLAAGPLRKSSQVPGGPPPGLIAYKHQPASSGPVKIDGVPAMLYRWAPTSGTDADAYVIPTGSGDLVALCQVTKADANLQPCVALVSALKLSGAATVKPGPDKALTASITNALHPALARRSSIGTLDGSTYASRQTGAQSVAAADAKAAKAVAKIHTPARFAPQVKRLSNALASESAAFTKLAKAAGTSDGSAYGDGVNAVDGATKQTSQAAAALAPYGIKLPKVSTLSLAAAPAPIATFTAPATTPQTTPQSTPTTPFVPQQTTPPSNPGGSSSGGGSSGGGSSGANCSSGCTIG
jgi:Hsp70 protein